MINFLLGWIEIIVGNRLLFTNVFSFSYNVFKGLFCYDCQNMGLCGKGLIDYRMTKFEVLHGSVVKFLTHNQEVLGHLGFSWECPRARHSRAPA